MQIWLPSGDRDGLFGKLIKPLTCEVRKAISTIPLSVSGQPFVKRFALCYRSVVCLSCPVCLSICPVCDVRALWPNGWTDQDKTWQAGRPRPWPPGHIVLDGDPATPPQRGTAPQFSAHICRGQMAAWIKMPLGMELDLGTGDLVLDGDLAPPPPKRGGAPKFSAEFYWGQTAGWIKMVLGTKVGLSPGDFVLDGDLAPPPPKGGGAPPQIFGPCLLWPNGWMDQDVLGTEIGLSLIHI